MSTLGKTAGFIPLKMRSVEEVMMIGGDFYIEHLCRKWETWVQSSSQAEVVSTYISPFVGECFNHQVIG